MKISIQATTASVTRRELEANLPRDVISRLNENAVAYIIAEEGASRPRVVGEGSAILKWSKGVVKKIAASVSRGVKFFARHNADNSTDGRPALGDILGAFVREVGGRAQAVAVGILKELDPALDVCSIEADVRLGQGNAVEDVDAVTGVALSSSHVDSPAFAGARRLAILQCFDGEPSDDKADAGKARRKGDKLPTFDEVVAFIRDRNVFPSQLFDERRIREDRNFAPFFEKADKIGQVEKELADTRAKLAETEKAAASATRSNAIATAKARLATLVPEGATEKQRAFILAKVNPEKLERHDDESLKAAIGESLKEFAEVAKLFAVPGETSGEGNPPPDNSAGGDKKDAGTGVNAALAQVIGGK